MIISFNCRYFSFSRKYILLPVLLLAFYSFAFAQTSINFTIPDSLKLKTYDELTTAFAADRNDSINRNLYAKTYIAKATKDRDSLRMAMGYELMGFIYYKDYPKSFVFYNKAIEVSENLGNLRYPAILYTYKGAVLSTDGKHKEALENHLKAIEYAELNNNKELLYVNKHNIGILKTHLELYDEALQIFKECYIYELYNKERDEEDFMYSHFSLADVYTATHELDSAIKYNIQGKKLALKLKNNDIQTLFSLNRGIIYFHQKKYKKSTELLENAIDSLHDSREKLTIINGLYHMAKSYDSLHQKDKAILNYKKVDSLFNKHPYHISSVIMNTYKALYTHYKTINDKENEAVYINKALLAHDTHKKDYQKISNKIIKTFDRRKLLEKQKELNKALSQKDKKYTTFIILAFIVFAIFIFTLLIFYIKQRNTKKRFHEFVEHQKRKASEIATEKTTPAINKNTKDIGLAEDVIDQLLNSLENFETAHTYIQSDITLPSLSKRFKTNSAYLSKVINTYKNKKFAEYLNDLRVAYAIEKIQSDKHFRLYTIKAIALEVGFNNSQSFARAFKRKTNIKPSDFIRQLEETKI
ncbi:helix-turn-helix domain-containing protein [Kordia sp.]|uniref:helix-turn-helix domain-containing protein n=1 Tax=Kordia sp. TaxID=1965332 RepID=UPI003B5B05BB